MTEDFKVDASDVDLSSLWEDDPVTKTEESSPEKDIFAGDYGIVTNPMTAELIDTNDIDILISAAIEVKSILVDLKCFEQVLRISWKEFQRVF